VQHTDLPILIISASDSSGAAGMQVDLRVVNDLGHPVRCAPTALTVQGGGGLIDVDPATPGNLMKAVESAVSDPPGIAAVKIGLITGEETALAVSECLLPLGDRGIPIVLDPVMKSTPGSRLTSDGAKKVLSGKILPMVSVVTPNREELGELAALAGSAPGVEEVMAQTLIRAGTEAVLVTGGDDGGSVCLDVLYQGKKKPLTFRHPRIGSGPTRGTGCALSSALSVFLGRGLPLDEAADLAIKYVSERIQRASSVGNWRLLFPGKPG